MTLRHVHLCALMPLLLAAQAHGAEVAIKSGIIKGTITAAGKPTTDVVISLEVSRQKPPKPKSRRANRRRR